ncbi:MAG: alpha/beta hydrolase [Chloroflexota bacterium]
MRFRQFMIYLSLIYLIYAALVYVYQRQVLFPGQGVYSQLSPPNDLAGLEINWIEAEAGPVEVWFIPAPTASATTPAPVVIHTHGNGEVIDFWPAHLAPFLDMGISLMLVEYPGYGRSAGQPSQQSIEQVMLAAYDQLVVRPEVDAQRIIAYGRSLGGGVACVLAAQRPTAALILESTWTSTRPFLYRFGLPGFMARDPFDNLAVVSNYKNPLLIMHGVADTVIPYSHGQKLAQQASQGTFLSYQCGHNDCPPNKEQYWADISRFLREGGIIPK